MPRQPSSRVILGSFIALLALAASANLAAADEDAPSFRRFALYIGSNNGGRQRVPLAYAASDARAMATVMGEVGGVSGGDSVLLTDPGVATISRSFAQMGERIRTAKGSARRIEFLVYYSGHSDEEGLLLGEERLPYIELRRRIEATQADVKIAILDSCSSGSFTRLKGGTRHPAFLLDESVSTTGYAFLTSSSENEAAQESDRIGASFFTYYLVSALRGAADTAGHGKVTLNEAYSYASAETLARTATTEAGPQHASYEIRLSGSGDLVLTDLRETSAAIVVQSDVQGRLFLRNADGRLVAELRKAAGAPITLSLPAGRYTITLEQNGFLSEKGISLRSGSRVPVASRDLVAIAPESTRIRGGSTDRGERLEHVTTYVGLVPSAQAENRRVIHAFGLSILDDSYRVDGIDVGFGTMIREDVRGGAVGLFFNTAGRDVTGVQASGIFNIGNGTMGGVQASGVFNLAAGPVGGIQAGGVFNISSGSVRGAQGAGVFNIADGELSGVQGSGVFNVADGSVLGGQGAGVFNVSAGGMRGIQGAGVFNLAGGAIQGVQLAGVFNWADSVNGGQLGTVNVAGGTRGAQIGVVNVGGDVHGTQIGLVNISRNMYGVPIGLINISKNGLFNPSFWSDENGVGYLGLQMGAGGVYTVIYGGLPMAENSGYGAIGAGMGLHASLSALYMDIDLSAKQPLYWNPGGQGITGGVDGSRSFPGRGLVFPSLRASVGMKLFGPVALFGGMIFEGAIPGVTHKSEFHTGSPIQLNFGTANTVLELYPNWFIGMRL